MATIRDQLESARAGRAFAGRLEDLIGPDHGLAPAAVDVFDESLRAPAEPGRAKMAELLIDAARRADPLYAQGGNLIRDERAVDLLAGPCLLRRDGARVDCLDALLASVPAPLLHQRGALLVESLKRFPDETAFLLVAKAKPEQGAEVVDALARSAEWTDTVAAQIARAALGDRDVERRFVEEFVRESDPRQKEQRARWLGYIGTPAAQRTLASEMRSPLVFENPNVLRRSVRLALLEALRQSFAVEPSLLETQIEDDEGYARAERFLERALGVTFESPRPPFLKIEGFPAP
jgi:hypothetical protein